MKMRTDINSINRHSEHRKAIWNEQLNNQIKKAGEQKKMMQCETNYVIVPLRNDRQLITEYKKRNNKNMKLK